MWSLVLIAFAYPLLISPLLVSSACIPDFPSKLLHDAAVLKHPAVIAAFQGVEHNLSTLFFNTTRDGLSFAVVHASSNQKAYSFNHGYLKMNETDNTSNTTTQVTSDSIFRVVSVSKNFAMFSALLVENESRQQTALPELSMDTPVRLVLPEFRLPQSDWDNGGRDITLLMLASHTSGLPRESYLTPFYMITGVVLDTAKNTNLMFAPGQRAAYSNTGISILASAVVAYHDRLINSSLTWSALAMTNIFAPLNMTNSFFGTIPDRLIPSIGVPGGPNFVDLVVGLGYDPAAGLWTSSNDVSRYLYEIWLRPDPSMITVSQRRRTLRPTITLPDGIQQAGPAFEIDLMTIPVSNATSKTYSSYGKSGDGGGFHAWMDMIPSLGYGIVIMSQHSGLANYSRIVPTLVRDSVHKILLPAFAKAVADTMERRFGGRFAYGHDSGIFTEEVATTGHNSTTYAKLEVVDQVLYLRELAINGTSALEGLDRLGWEKGQVDGPKYWSTPEGVVLTPAEGTGESEEFGPGSQVWRMMLPGLEVCDWFDFDGYTDNNGWPLSKVVLVEKDGSVELHYPPYDIVVTKKMS